VNKGRAEVHSILDYTDASGDLIKAEKRLLKDISKRLMESDVWLTHYGTWYDTIFVNTRLLYHRLPVLPPNFPHIDTWKVARNRLKLRNNRLITISEFLGTDEEKNAIKPEQWIRALGGHRSSMNYIVEHCRRDVVVLEEVYNLIKPLILDHPHTGLVGKKGECPYCGSKRLQKRGEHRTRTRFYQRYHCQNCLRWPRSAKPTQVFTTAV
jgi:hypothetical protein